jgi:hypothetical protein
VKLGKERNNASSRRGEIVSFLLGGKVWATDDSDPEDEKSESYVDFEFTKNDV